jgi:hypothetical protein
MILIIIIILVIIYLITISVWMKIANDLEGRGSNLLHGATKEFAGQN